MARYDEAERVILDAIRIYESALGPRSRESATAMDRLAQLFRKTNRESEASEIIARAKAVRFDLDHTVSVEQLGWTQLQR
jgi:Tetratricopeptide repeat